MNKLITIYLIISIILLILAVYTNRTDHKFKKWKYFTIPVVCFFWGIYLMLILASCIWKSEKIEKILEFVDKVV